LGNKFLATIRECAVLLQVFPLFYFPLLPLFFCFLFFAFFLLLKVVRCFEDSNIIHVESRVDPLQDMKILEAELILSDLESVERRLTKKKEEAINVQILQRCLSCLGKQQLCLQTPSRNT